MTQLETIEVLYRDIQDDPGQDWYSVAHRVIRQTKSYVYVAQDPYDPEQQLDDELDLWDLPTYRLSRKILAQRGYAFVPITADVDDPLFFTTPYSERRITQGANGVFDCFNKLGLAFPYSESDVRAAYRRLAKATHPDQGGSHEEFLTLRQAYEQALKMCQED